MCPFLTRHAQVENKTTVVVSLHVGQLCNPARISLDLHGHHCRSVLNLRHPLLLRHVLDKVAFSPTERDDKRIRHDELAVVGRFREPEPFRRSERPRRLERE